MKTKKLSILSKPFLILTLLFQFNLYSQFNIEAGFGGVSGDLSDQLSSSVLFDFQYNIIDIYESKDVPIRNTGYSESKEAFRFQTYLSGGIRYAFGKEKVDSIFENDVSFAPLGAGLRVGILPFYLSVNGGYALSLTEQVEDGISYRASLSIKDFPFPFFNLTVSYENIEVNESSLEVIYGGFLIFID